MVRIFSASGRVYARLVTETARPSVVLTKLFVGNACEVSLCGDVVLPQKQTLRVVEVERAIHADEHFYPRVWFKNGPTLMRWIQSLDSPLFRISLVRPIRQIIICVKATTNAVRVQLFRIHITERNMLTALRSRQRIVVIIIC